MDEFRTLLKIIGNGRMSSTAYDTAWVARLEEIAPDLSQCALNWLIQNQLPDGSWGVKEFFYYYDRVICTLAALIALKSSKQKDDFKSEIEVGISALETILSSASDEWMADSNKVTIGFELILPTLVVEAESLGILQKQSHSILRQLDTFRVKKLNKLAGQKIDYRFTLAFSSEMAGLDNVSILDVENLQEENGSVANSPSATAYFARYLKRAEPRAMQYLYKWIDAGGGVPNVAPFDVFEPAWVLWNLKLIPNLDTDMINLCMPHLDWLQNQWNPKAGIAHTSQYAPRDGDDSALVFETLSFYDRKVNIEGVLSYEEDGYFRCFALEANPSISTNIHVLGALRENGFDRTHPSVQKVLNFLRNSRNASDVWVDKWHISPYYPTSHAIILSHQYDKAMCEKAIQWIIKSQNQNGSWGEYVPTAEETAYALQALCVWKSAGYKVENKIIKSGYDWLVENSEMPYPPLWIGKALYCPEYVVRATILSAIVLARKTL